MVLEDIKIDNTLSAFLDHATDKFLRAGVASPRLDAEVLVADALKVSRTQLIMQSGRVLNRVEKDILCRRIERRVLREPVSHITGFQEFWSLKFAVNAKVLTPRPETEILVEQCLKALNVSNPKILDLGTGSGILPIVLAKEIPQSRITAIEKSTEALQVARKNASCHAVADRICFVAGDLMELDWQGPYHLIVSNPPYIADLSKCMPEVRQYEPALALDGGTDGLDYYRFIVSMAWKKLQENGLLVLEIGHTQAPAVLALLKSSSRYQDIQVVQDYSGYDRVVLARGL